MVDALAYPAALGYAANGSPGRFTDCSGWYRAPATTQPPGVKRDFGGFLLDHRTREVRGAAGVAFGAAFPKLGEPQVRLLAGQYMRVYAKGQCGCGHRPSPAPPRGRRRRSSARRGRGVRRPPRSVRQRSPHRRGRSVGRFPSTPFRLGSLPCASRSSFRGCLGVYHSRSRRARSLSDTRRGSHRRSRWSASNSAGDTST